MPGRKSHESSPKSDEDGEIWFVEEWNGVRCRNRLS